MKIDFVVVSTDNNSLYDGFWDICKKTWNEVVGVTPLLVIIGDEDKIQRFDDSIIVTFKKVESIKTSFQSQIARLYVASLFPDNTLLTSDIDMFPLSKDYFIDFAELGEDTQLLIYIADAYGFDNQMRYPICYNLAKGTTYIEILNLECSFHDFVNRIYSLKYEPLWDSDELYLGMCVNSFEKNNKGRILKKHRGFREGHATNRIDRDYWGKYDLNKISEQFYYDFHSMRPYVKYKKEIDGVLNRLLIFES